MCVISGPYTETVIDMIIKDTLTDTVVNPEFKREWGEKYDPKNYND